MTTKHTEPPQTELFLASGEPSQPQPDFLGFKITAMGLVITDEDMPYEKWFEGLKALHTLEGQIGLAKAKYIAFGIAKYGRDKVDVGFAQLELPLQDVKRAIDISTVPENIKFRNLDADHYVVLARADLTPKKLAHWARIASVQGLSAPALKASINAGEVVSGKVAEHQQHGILSLKGTVQEFLIWLRRMGGAAALLKLEPEVQKEIIEDLEPFAKLYNELLAKTNAYTPESLLKSAAKKSTKKK
jgi:hypothetical protein